MMWRKYWKMVNVKVDMVLDMVLEMFVFDMREKMICVVLLFCSFD